MGHPYPQRDPKMNIKERTCKAMAAATPGETSKQYLRPREAAQYVGHSESTLAKLRMKHMRENGPAFIKRGGVILYRQADLDAWLDTFVVQ